jgi:hypothetical protein
MNDDTIVSDARKNVPINIDRENIMDIMLNENGRDYHVLVDAAKAIKGVEGMTVEIGLREGGGSKNIIDTLIQNSDLGRTHIAIDPYGHIEYRLKDNETVTYDYHNDMRNRTIASMYAYIQNKNINFLFFPLEDSEFFIRFSDGVPTYSDKSKRMETKYALVYFDGPHTTQDTFDETQFFMARAVPGSIFVYDDIEGYYDHEYIKKHLFQNGWIERMRSTTKNSYIKTNV